MIDIAQEKVLSLRGCFGIAIGAIVVFLLQ